MILRRSKEGNYQAILASLTRGQCLDREQGIKDCRGGGGDVLKSLLWPQIIGDENIKEYECACSFMVCLFYPFPPPPPLLLFIPVFYRLLPAFYPTPHPPTSLHPLPSLRLMHLTNH